MATCGECKHFRMLPPMGSGYPPYDCEKKLFYATWYNNPACEDFETNARNTFENFSYRKESEDIENVDIETFRELFMSEGSSKTSKSSRTYRSYTLREFLLSNLLPPAIGAFLGMYIFPSIIRSADPIASGFIGMIIGIGFLIIKNAAQK